MLESVAEALSGSKANVEGINFGKIFQNLAPNMLIFILHIAICFVLWIIGKKLIKIVIRVVEKALQISRAKRELYTITQNIIKIIGYVIIFVAMAHVLNLPIAPVLTILGSLGLGVVLALKDYLTNLAGGVLLLCLTPFLVGDFIIDGDKNEGTVNKIGLFYTTLVTVDGKTVVIPNSILTKSYVINVTREGKRRVDVCIGISYRADLKKAKKIMEDLILEEKACLFDPPYQVVVASLEESAVIIQGMFWVRQEDYWISLCNMKENIKLAYDANNIEIPFNQLDVHVSPN